MGHLVPAWPDLRLRPQHSVEFRHRKINVQTVNECHKQEDDGCPKTKLNISLNTKL